MAIPGKAISGKTILCRKNSGQAIPGNAIPGKIYQDTPDEAISGNAFPGNFNQEIFKQKGISTLFQARQFQEKVSRQGIIGRVIPGISGQHLARQLQARQFQPISGKSNSCNTIQKKEGRQGNFSKVNSREGNSMKGNFS